MIEDSEPGAQKAAAAEYNKQDGQSLTLQESVRIYLELYTTAVDVQKHFNDIEWRIRGLALTVLTFALGAAGVAAKDGSRIGSVSLAAAVLILGLLLWYAFYYVDRYWYHPLLKAAVEQGRIYEQELAKHLPLANMTGLITTRSPQTANFVLRRLAGVKRGEKTMHSDDKLRWFYRIGFIALGMAAAAQGASLYVMHIATKQAP